MSNIINEKIKENLVSEIERWDSSLEEFAMIRPEYLRMSDVEQMEAMQDYINYLKYKQGQEKMEPDYDQDE